MSRCTPSIAGSLRSRRPCGGWARWSRAAANRRRWSALWPRKCAGAWVRSPLDCGVSKQAARSRWWPPPPIRPRLPSGRSALARRSRATPSQRRCSDTGLPARIDSYENIAGSVAARVRAVGVRAAVGVPIIVDGSVWGLAAVGSVEPGPMPADTEMRISRFAELIATALVAGYRDEQKRQLLGEASQRPFLIDFVARGANHRSLEPVRKSPVVCGCRPMVRLSSSRRRFPSVGSEALPEIESKLRSRDVYSAWRLQPDLQVGIVHVKSDRHLDEILALVTRLATDRVGVSARFDDLRDTPHALHFAKVMLRGRPDQASPVAVFDGSILATAAVSAPDVMVKSIGNALDGFDDLPDAEREMLFETFRVWQDNDASVRSAAEVLICHPNTVRHRLRRIEKHTGRSLSRPKDVAELCLAFEVHRRLM